MQTVNNLGIALTDLPMVYLFPGIVAMFVALTSLLTRRQPVAPLSRESPWWDWPRCSAEPVSPASRCRCSAPSSAAGAGWGCGITSGRRFATSSSCS